MSRSWTVRKKSFGLILEPLVASSGVVLSWTIQFVMVPVSKMALRLCTQSGEFVHLSPNSFSGVISRPSKRRELPPRVGKGRELRGLLRAARA